jgi:antibiotic biosynthesis monooxygenase (ABM) superfamily enzyme
MNNAIEMLLATMMVMPITDSMSGIWLYTAMPKKLAQTSWA